MLIEQFWKMGGHSQLYSTATDNNDKRLRKMIVRKHLGFLWQKITGQFALHPA